MTDRKLVAAVSLAGDGAETRVAAALWLGARLTGDGAVSDDTIKFGLVKLGGDADGPTDRLSRIESDG